MLGQTGEYLLVEQHTYTTVFETGLPLGFKFAQVLMDKDGLLPDDLDLVLSTWDESDRGGKKPRLLYTIPTGQNPTGITQPLSRRREIYRIAQKHELFIIEDDPYYFIQLPVYRPGESATATTASVTSVEKYIETLIPSYLRLDTDGRVLRMDSFSKIVAPGARMGWVTASEQVIERMIRAHEVSVQNPSGFSQIAIFKLLHDSWGHLGFVRWLAHLRGEYTKRRNSLLEACDAFLPREIVRWVPPTGGFFVSLPPVYPDRLIRVFASPRFARHFSYSAKKRIDRLGSLSTGCNIPKQVVKPSCRSRRKSTMRPSSAGHWLYQEAGFCRMRAEEEWKGYFSV